MASDPQPTYNPKDPQMRDHSDYNPDDSIPYWETEEDPGPPIIPDFIDMVVIGFVGVGLLYIVIHVLWWAIRS